MAIGAFFPAAIAAGAPAAAPAAAAKSTGSTLAIAAGVTQGLGFLSAGFGQASAAEAQADIAKQQAISEQQRARREAQDFRRRQSRVLAAARARGAGSGITAAGSPLLVQGDIAAELERGAQRILEGGDIAATRLRSEADIKKSQARGFRTAGLLGATGSLLSAGAPLFAEDGE